MRLFDALDRMKKSQLQAYFQYWYPDLAMESSREKLVSRLQEAMTNPTTICRRFDTLRSPERRFLQGLLLLPDSTGSVGEIRSQGPCRRIEDFETESILRRLREQGFLHKAFVDGQDGRPVDCFLIPEEIAGALQTSVDGEQRAAEELLSLRLAAGCDLRRTAALADIAAVRARIKAVTDPTLRAVIWSALEDYGGILPLSVWRRAGGQGRLSTPEWRHALQEAHLGTAGMLNLKEFGIDLEEEALCIHQEIVVAHAHAHAFEHCGEEDSHLRVGADLLIDLSRLLQIVVIHPLELTREGSLYKRADEKLRGEFVLSGCENLFEGGVLAHLIALAERLSLVERRNGHLRAHGARSKAWERSDVLERIKRIYELFVKERGRERYSFHQRYLRRIFIDMLAKSPVGRPLSTHGFVRAVTARFLLSLGALKIRHAFKERVDGSLRDEMLLVPLERLSYDLYFWLVHRLALLGIVDLGYRRGHLYSLALSPLGAAVLGCPAAGSDGQEGLLVNPDFEVLQFPGGIQAAEDAFFLSRFADRLGSDRVRRYRITRDSVKRAALTGLTIDAMLSFLSARAREEVPGNVLYTIREWADGLELVRRQHAVVLRSRTPGGMDRLVEVLAEAGESFERVGPTVMMLTGTNAERSLVQLKDKLQEEGLHID